METVQLGLQFRVANKHFRQGDMKLKCLATIATVYLQSNEESVEGDESVLKTSMMESRETRAQSHTREDLANGKLPERSPAPVYFLTPSFVCLLDRLSRPVYLHTCRSRDHLNKTDPPSMPNPPTFVFASCA